MISGVIADFLQIGVNLSGAIEGVLAVARYREP